MLNGDVGVGGDEARKVQAPLSAAREDAPMEQQVGTMRMTLPQIGHKHNALDYLDDNSLALRDVGSSSLLSNS